MTALLFAAGFSLLVALVFACLWWREKIARRRAENDLKRLRTEYEDRIMEHTTHMVEASSKELEDFGRSVSELEQALARRTAQLEATNQELEAFAYSVSHDLRAPLRSIDGFSQALLEDCAKDLDETGNDYLRRMRVASQRMGQLIDDLLKLSRLTRGEMQRGSVDLGQLVREIAEQLQQADPERSAEFIIAPQIVADGDARLLRVALENLLGNAWKFTSGVAVARIEFNLLEPSEATNAGQGGKTIYRIRDNGAGFDMAFSDNMFSAFQRLHSTEEFPGTGIGLATVQRIIHRHGGQIWAKGAVGQGATFCFTL